ncbi:DUF2846 domain-containing protein [Ideonella sp. YS5]|uniref:DUF2846 domain-containing protein n=1 Tax=Ideonella sp. YS5 TaxID=3453714 RepID=UPI003EEA6AE6
MRSLILVVSAVLATLLTACTASGPIYSQAAAPVGDQALVYLYRVRTPFGAWVPMKVEVNGKEIGILANDSYTTVYVPAGDVSLSATRWQDFHYPDSKRVSVSGRVAGGETYYLRISQSSSGSMITTNLERVSAVVGESELKVLKRAEPVK